MKTSKKKIAKKVDSNEKAIRLLQSIDRNLAKIIKRHEQMDEVMLTLAPYGLKKLNGEPKEVFTRILDIVKR